MASTCAVVVHVKSARWAGSAGSTASSEKRWASSSAVGLALGAGPGASDEALVESAVTSTRSAPQLARPRHASDPAKRGSHPRVRMGHGYARDARSVSTIREAATLAEPPRTRAGLVDERVRTAQAARHEPA